ncbi:hypothetical protein NQ317_018127 [Molorchus minor]|uniref:UDP-glucuronosyltransferase n=1 Tax=Molorchus minor TaxID=1323400 RepID=A0ABQ9IUE2_9CUCU|nr:hypothetical protein NQ317_018127 [Molorchus minor]
MFISLEYSKSYYDSEKFMGLYKEMLVVKLFVFTFVIRDIAQSARILGVFQMPSVSHQCVFQSLWKELSLRGHEVTVVTPNPLRDPSLTNLTEIDVSYMYEIMQRHGFQYFMSKELPIYNGSTVNFDLIIAQTYVSPILYTLSAKLNVPIIGISSMGGWIGSHIAMGNPNIAALYSEMFLHYNGIMTFYERLSSTIYNLWVRYFLTFEALPKGDQIARKYLGNGIPYLGDVEKNLSLLFLTTNTMLYTPRPTVPTIIPIQQLHINPYRNYHILGSNVKSVNMAERLRNVLIETFAELPYTVLWKWESDELPGKPDNVITKKWLPQQDLLAHPNIKVFITQCGLQSIEEAISREVPMVGVPFIADQPMNIKRLVEIGVAIGIDYLTVTKEELKSAIVEVAENNRYKENMVSLRNLLQDEPMRPLDKAVWWTEYVLRHKGTGHLKQPMSELSWFEYLLADVFLVIILMLTLVVYACTKLIQSLIKLK